MKDLKSTFDESKGWLMLGFGAYLVYKFSGVFTAIADTATAGAEAATAAARDAAQVNADKAKVKYVAPSATAEQLSLYKADAATIVAAFGTGPGYSSNFFFEDTATAFAVLKRYSRLMLYNNLPYDVTTKKTQSVETKSSAQRKVNYHVLVPFYKEQTGGRDLVADAKKFLKLDVYTKYLKWIL